MIHLCNAACSPVYTEVCIGRGKVTEITSVKLNKTVPNVFFSAIPNMLCTLDEQQDERRFRFQCVESTDALTSVIMKTQACSKQLHHHLIATTVQQGAALKR